MKCYYISYIIVEICNWKYENNPFLEIECKDVPSATVHLDGEKRHSAIQGILPYTPLDPIWAPPQYIPDTCIVNNFTSEYTLYIRGSLVKFSLFVFERIWIWLASCVFILHNLILSLLYKNHFAFQRWNLGQPNVFDGVF